MFATSLLIPSLTFFILGSHAHHVLRTIITDVLRSILCRVGGAVQGGQMLTSEVVFCRGTSASTTKEVKSSLAQAQQRQPLARQQLLDVKCKRKGAFLAVTYRCNGSLYVRYYPCNRPILFPPTASRNPASAQAQAHLVFQCFQGPSGCLSKLLRWDVSELVAPLLGPSGDWFGSTQKKPLVAYHHLLKTINKVIRQEFRGVSPGQLRVTLKVQQPTRASLSLSKYAQGALH